mmetsp:Transcript_55851/g.149508  ORF Transcript_55851/g.149508 Transcript_55851/m.149508 type:complete len:446 (-) Transcript_55851:663-2000(-)
MVALALRAAPGAGLDGLRRQRDHEPLSAPHVEGPGQGAPRRDPVLHELRGRARQQHRGALRRDADRPAELAHDLPGPGAVPDADVGVLLARGEAGPEEPRPVLRAARSEGVPPLGLRLAGHAALRAHELLPALRHQPGQRPGLEEPARARPLSGGRDPHARARLRGGARAAPRPAAVALLHACEGAADPDVGSDLVLLRELLLARACLHAGRPRHAGRQDWQLADRAPRGRQPHGRAHVAAHRAQELPHAHPGAPRGRGAAGRLRPPEPRGGAARGCPLFRGPGATARAPGLGRLLHGPAQQRHVRGDPARGPAGQRHRHAGRRHRLRLALRADLQPEPHPRHRLRVRAQVLPANVAHPCLLAAARARQHSHGARQRGARVLVGGADRGGRGGRREGRGSRVRRRAVGEQPGEVMHQWRSSPGGHFSHRRARAGGGSGGGARGRG